MKEFVISEVKVETAIIVGLITPQQNERKTNEYLDELEFLAETAGAKVIKRYTQRVNGPSSVTYIGSGKLDEIKQFIKQQEDARDQALEMYLESGITDPREQHLPDEVGMVIFAQYKYMLPRLTRLWTHLERQRGGSVGLRGPGETQLEMDQRIIRNRMALLKQRLADIDTQKRTQRNNRGRMIRVALVGYTNVGKSTIMNLLSKSEVFAENKLFATLDTTVRKVIIDNLPFLLSDTVGFIRKLPTDLVDSFKSTLDEVREADLLIHVVDISHPDFEEQIHVVEKTLGDLGAADKPSIIVFNKIDAYTWVEKDEDDLTPKTRENITLDELMQTWMAKLGEDCFFISAKEKTNIPELKQLMYKKVRELHVQKYPYNDFLYQNYEEE